MSLVTKVADTLLAPKALSAPLVPVVAARLLEIFADLDAASVTAAMMTRAVGVLARRADVNDNVLYSICGSICFTIQGMEKVAMRDRCVDEGVVEHLVDMIGDDVAKLACEALAVARGIVGNRKNPVAYVGSASVQPRHLTAGCPQVCQGSASAWRGGGRARDLRGVRDQQPCSPGEKRRVRPRLSLRRQAKPRGRHH